MMTFISKKYFYVTSGLANMTSLCFQLRISLLYVGLSQNLIREMRIVDITMRSYKISFDLEGHLDILGQLQGKCRFISPFITPSILYRITSNFLRWLLKKELPIA